MISNILDRLAEMNHCYISDLRLTENRLALVSSLRMLNSEDYVLDDWQIAGEYLTDKIIDSKDRSIIKNSIIRHLRIQYLLKKEVNNII